MGISATPVRLGRFGVWFAHPALLPGLPLTPDLAARVEELGYGTIWVGSAPTDAKLTLIEKLLDATSTIAVASGIVNIWTSAAPDVADTYHRLEQKFPGRFLLGIGAGHREADGGYATPYQAMVGYLDELDERGVPADRRVLAALGPRMLRLAADRAAGAHPYLVPTSFSRTARNTLGGSALLAIEHKVVLGADRERNRVIAGEPIGQIYLNMGNYRANLLRLGFSEADLADGGSAALIDSLVAQGTPQAVASVVREHLDAGADHVAVHVLPDLGDPVGALASLGRVLELATPDSRQ